MNAVLLKRPFIIDILLLEPKTSIVGFKLDDTHSLAHSEAEPAASPDAVSVCEWLKPLAVHITDQCSRAVAAGFFSQFPQSSDSLRLR